jgi:cytochrome c-type biogenesis protein CcmH
VNGADRVWAVATGVAPTAQAAGASNLCRSEAGRDRRLEKLRAVLLAALLLAVPAFAIDPLPFADAAEAQRFQALVAELRCLVCQNQNLADSDAGLAKDLRNEIFAMMRAGKSDAEIREFLVARYGDFVLYRPPVKPTTWLLWFGPAVVVVVGLGAIIAIVRRRARELPADAGGVEDLP